MLAGSHPPQLSGQVDAVGRIETRGVDYIPDVERHSSPLNVFWILIGANLTFGLIVLGWLPVSFGLGWWPSFWSIIVGDALGALILAPVALLGPRTGTNGPVSSGAFFGVVGRILGSGIGIFVSVGFYALAVWTGGQAAVAGMHRLFGMPSDNLVLGVSYGVIAVVSSIVAIYGHASMVLVERLMIPIAGLLLVVGVFVYAPHFSAGYKGGAYLLGSFWPTWILAVTIAAVAVYGYVLFVSDWTRYISLSKHSETSILWATWLGGFLGLSLPLVFGAYTAVAILGTKLDYVPGIIALSPAWYLLPLIVIGIIGSLGQSAVCLYSSGLDFSSIVPPSCSASSPSFWCSSAPWYGARKTASPHSSSFLASPPRPGSPSLRSGISNAGAITMCTTCRCSTGVKPAASTGTPAAGTCGRWPPSWSVR